MSLDIYLEARIKEKSGRIISSDIDQKYYDEEDLIERACLHEGEIFEVLQGGSEWKWIEKGSYEKMNLCNAEKLHDLIWNLNLIQYENTILLDGSYIPDKRDLALLEKNPAAYDWEFRICNSY